MYLVQPTIDRTAEQWQSASWTTFTGVFVNLWSTLLFAIETMMMWIDKLGPSLSYTLKALDNLTQFVRAHPHPFHIVGWAIFFGPIILLLPGLLLLELGVLLGTYVSYLGHGFVPPHPQEECDDDFEEDPFSSHTFPTLQVYTTETRESLFARVELWTAMVNKWTSAHPALLVFRVFAGILSSCLFLGLLWGWW